MSEYWFQKQGKNKYTPTNWKGWALFTFVIGLIVSTIYWADNPLIVGVYAVIVAFIGYKLMDLKRAPDNEVVDIKNGQKIGTVLLGCILGLVCSLLLFIVIQTIKTSLNQNNSSVTNSEGKIVSQPSDIASITSVISPATTTIKVTSVNSEYQNYQNPTMMISSLSYPKGWTVAESTDKLNATFNSADQHVDISTTLYAGNSSYDLSILFLDIQQGSQQNDIQITQHQIETINNKEWLTYSYKTQEGNKFFDNEAALYILPGNNQRQFVKFQMESDADHFSSDLIIFKNIINSVIFSTN